MILTFTYCEYVAVCLVMMAYLPVQAELILSHTLNNQYNAATIDPRFSSAVFRSKTYKFYITTTDVSVIWIDWPAALHFA